MKRLLLVSLAALGALAAVVVLVVLSRDGTPGERRPLAPADEAPPDASPTPAVELAPAAPQVPERVEVPGAASEGSATAAPAADSPEEGAAGVAAPAGDGDLVRVRIVRGDTDAALPGATAFVLGRSDVTGAEVMGVAGGEDGFAGLVRSRGRAHVADARGELRLPREPAWILAEADGLRGEALLDPDDKESLEVRLEPLVARRARVADARGAPIAGVPVELRLHVGTLSQAFARATSAEDGVAAIHLSRSFLTELRADVGERAGTSLALAAILAEPVEVEIDVEDPPREPVKLVLPPTGAVEVLVAGAEGARNPIWVAIAPKRADAFTAFSAALRPFGGAVRVEDGRARFPFVGLGLDLVAVAQASEARSEPVEAAGPAVPGQLVTIPLRVDLRPLVALRVLDADGNPLADTVLEVEGLDWYAGTHRTDGDARLELAPPEGLGAGEEVLTVSSTDPDVRPPHAARVTIRLPLPPTGLDLGDVVLEPPPLLAAGRVVDAEGSPLPGARVWLLAELRAPWDGTTTWSRHGQPLTSTRSDGKFELRGWPPEPATHLALQADAAGHAPSEIRPLESGATGVELRLRAPGALRVRVLLEGRPLAQETLVVRRAGGGDIVEHARKESATDGTTLVTELVPDRYDVELHDLAIAEDVLVRPGETTDLGTIDLAGRLHRYVVHVRRPDGEAVERVEYVAFATSERREPRNGAVEGGTVELLTPAERVDVVLTVGGFPQARLVATPGEHEVRLEKPVTLRCVLDPPPPPLPPGLALLVRAISEEHVANDFPLSSGSEIVDDAGAATIPALAPRPHRVEVHLAVRASRVPTHHGLVVPPTPVDLTAAVGEHVLRLPLDLDALDRALEQR